MRKLLALRRDERGASAIEMAIAVPVLTLFLWGIFQIGIAGQAIAGMQHGLGEGARLATLCLNPTATGNCSVPTNTAIRQKINDKVFGTHIGTFTVADPVSGVDASGSTYLDLSVTFTMPMDFLFFQGPNINLTQSKRVFIAA